MSSGLLAVHAHPDDETLATGALLATWAAAGLPVTVVTCTRGELGEVIGVELAHLEGDGPALAARREGELAAALRALGVADHVFLDAVPTRTSRGQVGAAAGKFSDSGMAWATPGRAGRLDDLPDGAFVGVPLDDAAGRLAQVVRERRPAVVVTYEPGGGYGHPDHVRAHEVTTRAVELAADPSVVLGGLTPHEPAEVLWAAVAAEDLRSGRVGLPALAPVAAELAAHRELTVPRPEGPLPSVAVPRSAIDLVVDVTAVLDRVVGALQAHATQVRSVVVDDARAATVRAGGGEDAGGAAVVVGCYALSNDELAPLLSSEAYRRAPASRAPASRAPRAGPRVVWPGGVRPVP
ncbi:PIG-L family deacetylase [Cellulomonas fimi]|uniref:GlcNAc-PI de-N-acetylase n=1 Tax=Cellulomonas fimi TaxID=1708 RepID=A0A7Y0LYR6_CELFI|nr:PIG-L family deacetylase [Cellulomonas fimi]NMR19873.1 GlcNAc-PI de-N-acetylase [Cellulomonas fimi]